MNKNQFKHGLVFIFSFFLSINSFAQNSITQDFFRFSLFGGINKNQTTGYQTFLINNQILRMYSNYSYSVGLNIEFQLPKNHSIHTGIGISTINSSLITDSDSINYKLQGQTRYSIWFGRKDSHYYHIPITFNKVILRKGPHTVFIGVGLGLSFLKDFKSSRNVVQTKKDNTSYHLVTELNNPKNTYLGLLTQFNYRLKLKDSNKSIGISFINCIHPGYSAIGRYEFTSTKYYSSGILIQKFNFFKVQMELIFN